MPVWRAGRCFFTVCPNKAHYARSPRKTWTPSCTSSASVITPVCWKTRPRWLPKSPPQTGARIPPPGVPCVRTAKCWPTPSPIHWTLRVTRRAGIRRAPPRPSQTPRTCMYTTLPSPPPHGVRVWQNVCWHGCWRRDAPCILRAQHSSLYRARSTTGGGKVLFCLQTTRHCWTVLAPMRSGWSAPTRTNPRRTPH